MLRDRDSERDRRSGKKEQLAARAVGSGEEEGFFEEARMRNSS